MDKNWVLVGDDTQEVQTNLYFKIVPKIKTPPLNGRRSRYKYKGKDTVGTNKKLTPAALWSYSSY